MVTPSHGRVLGGQAVPFCFREGSLCTFDSQTPPHNSLKVSVTGEILGGLAPPSLIYLLLSVSSSRTGITLYPSIDVKGDSAGHTLCPPLVSLADNTEQENINNTNKKSRAAPVSAQT